MNVVENRRRIGEMTMFLMQGILMERDRYCLAAG
jgi:hypothetical protein